MRLQAETFWWSPAPGPLLPQLHNELADLCRRQGGTGSRPLRWALTAAERGRGLRIEAVLVLEGIATAPPPSAPGQSGQAGPTIASGGSRAC